MNPPKYPDCRIAGGEPFARDAQVDGRYIAGQRSWRPRRARGDIAGGLSRRESDDQAGSIPRVSYPEPNRTIFPSPLRSGPPPFAATHRRLVENGRASETGTAGSRFSAGIVSRLIVPTLALASFQVERSRKKPKIVGHSPDWPPMREILKKIYPQSNKNMHARQESTRVRTTKLGNLELDGTRNAHS